MPANAYAGSAQHLEWVYSGGTVTLHLRSREFNWDNSLEFIDATAGRDTFEYLLGAIGRGQTIEIPIVAQTGQGTVYEAAFAKNVSGSLIYGPEGAVAGKQKYTIPGLAEGPSWSSPYNDVTIFTAKIRQNAEYTSGTF
jgi:hypothetical protein